MRLSTLPTQLFVTDRVIENSGLNTLPTLKLVWYWVLYPLNFLASDRVNVNLALNTLPTLKLVWAWVLYQLHYLSQIVIENSAINTLPTLKLVWDWVPHHPKSCHMVWGNICHLLGQFSLHWKCAVSKKLRFSRFENHYAVWNTLKVFGANRTIPNPVIWY